MTIHNRLWTVVELDPPPQDPVRTQRFTVRRAWPEDTTSGIGWNGSRWGQWAVFKTDGGSMRALDPDPRLVYHSPRSFN